MSGSDAELRSRAEELAYLEQRFDIHVMAFADSSEGTVQALQRAFAVDRATAERMIEGTPVVVKRGATPEVASALLDELGKVGAQVVLLPSDTKGSLPPAPRANPEPRPAAHASAPGAASSGQVQASAWGALNLPSAAPPPRVASHSLEGQLAGGFDGDGALEESLDGADDAPALPSDPAPMPAHELHLHSSAPPAFARRSRAPRRESQEIDLDDDGGSFEVSRMLVKSPLRASTPRTPRPTVPEPPALAPPPPPPPPPPEPRRSLKPSDLGLGTVPPLPPRKSQVEFVPLSPSNAPAPALSVAPRPPRGRPPPPAAPSPAPRHPAPVEPYLPPVPRGPETRKIVYPAAAAPAPAKPRRVAEPARGGAKRSPKTQAKQDQQRPPTGPVRTAFERDPFPAPALSGPRAEFPVPPQPGATTAPIEPVRAQEARRADKPSPAPSKPEEPPARGLALMMMLGAVLGVGLGIYVGDSVLQGMASPLSIALHGVALYGFGAGILGLRS